MEEEKAAAYYDELARKGEGAARFKQGLGFSSNSTTDDAVPVRGAALPLSSSFLSKFVRASSPSKASEFQKQAQLESIQNKLKKKPKSTSSEPPNQSSPKASIDRTKEKDKDSYRYRHSRRRSLSRSRSPSRDRDRHSRRRSGSRSRDRDRHSKRRSRSRSRSKSRDGYRSRDRYRHRSRSTSRDGDRDRRRERERDREKKRRRSRSRTISDEEKGRRKARRSRSKSRSVSPWERKSEKSGGDSDKVPNERNDGIDYSKLIEGYDKMTPAERVKTKMKLQLSETAEKDGTKGPGWERFEFNKDAPLDDEDIEAAEDDTALVKHLGQSFRFSAMEARREEEIKAAHDEAIFGALAHPPSNSTDVEERHDDKKESSGTDIVTTLISEQVLARQQGSWRERARKV